VVASVTPLGRLEFGTGASIGRAPISTNELLSAGLMCITFLPDGTEGNEQRRLAWELQANISLNSRKGI
jgi:hypothetical protein